MTQEILKPEDFPKIYRDLFNKKREEKLDKIDECISFFNENYPRIVEMISYKLKEEVDWMGKMVK